ncbi:MAG: hypothetical protein AAF196_11385 [Planctomycetota bacterium]
MQRLFGISVVVLASLATAAIGLPPEVGSTNEAEASISNDSLLGLSGDALFEQLGVPSQCGDAGSRLETWLFADDALKVTLISDQVIRVQGELPADFKPLQRPETGLFLGQKVGEAVQQLGQPLAINTGSQSIHLVFEGDRECAVVGLRGRIGF